MANGLKFYSDAALSNEISGSFTLSKEIGGSPEDGVVYLGSVETSMQYIADDGGDILVSVNDALPAGGDFEASDIKLAQSSSGLDSAAAGAALNLGSIILSGAGNAMPVYIRFSGDSAAPVNADSEISLSCSLTREFAQ